MNTQDKQINSAVNSCRMALYNNNKAKSTNKTTRLINNIFKKYRKDDTENENEDENTKLDTLSIGLQLKEAVDSIFDPTTGMSEEEKKKFVQKLYRKLESGKKLSADEMQYLRKNDPVTYAKAAKVQVLRESLKKQLKSATSKEKAADIYTHVCTMRTAGSLPKITVSVSELLLVTTFVLSFPLLFFDALLSFPATSPAACAFLFSSLPSAAPLVSALVGL